MEREDIKKKVFFVIAPYKQEDFTKEINEKVLLTDFFGRNRWHALGAFIIKAALEDEFTIEITDDSIYRCETIAEIVDVVTSVVEKVIISELRSDGFENDFVRQFAGT